MKLKPLFEDVFLWDAGLGWHFILYFYRRANGDVDELLDVLEPLHKHQKDGGSGRGLAHSLRHAIPSTRLPYAFPSLIS